MSAISKLFSKPTRTLVNTDIIPVQDSAGASWYKTNLAALKNFLYLDLLQTANAWSSAQTFNADVSLGNNKITYLANGTASGDAVNVSQLDAKQDTIISSATEVIVNIGGEPHGSSILSVNESDGLFNITPNHIPTSTADTLGVEHDITHDREYIYVKTNEGWKRALLTTF